MRILVVGAKGHGRLGVDQPFDHFNGRGSIREERGQYYDALKNKRATVVPMIIETMGGISPHSVRYISRLAARAKAGGRDHTAYGRSRTSARSFFVHHAQQLSAAAQVGDAKAIRRKITQLKVKHMKIMQARFDKGGGVRA